MDMISSSNESDSEYMSTDMLEDIFDRSQYHLSINRRESHHKISDFVFKKASGTEISVIIYAKCG